jgi:uncharacterized protein (TIGR00730 family)
VFCGSSPGTSPDYAEAAAAVARQLVDAGLGLVYGGNSRGLMGTLADAAMAAGGSVTGVLPTALFDVEMPHRGLTRLVEVGSMHERKQCMYDLADAFVGLPGGLGTLEEVAEIATWSQLGVHEKPIVLLDLDGFWRPLLGWLDHAVDTGFIKPANRSIIASVSTPAEVVGALRAYRRHAERAVITEAET